MQIGLQRLRAKMVTVGADGVLVTKPENMQYFSGFSGGEGALVITEEKAVLITDFRYTEQAEQETTGFVIVKQERTLMAEVVDVLK
ncbi:MAG: aminopeptidase P family N-terminal domain-containing protein, partial [Selenomonadales bacterium]|nr:aminopeptidase P family N-terminal domain-containing protein [Selenomonadales bacterium]